MSFTKIRFVTHARIGDSRTSAEAANAPLDQSEMQCAEQLGRYWKLTGYRPDAIHTTPSMACFQTAQIATCAFGGETRISVAEPSELHVTEESLRKIAAALIAKDSSTTPSSGSEVAPFDEEARALLTGGQLVRYAIALRAEDDPPKEVIAVTDHYSINSVVSLTEVGLSALGDDPRAQLSNMLARAPQEPCAESLLIAEGSLARGDFMLSVTYSGHSSLE